MFPWSSQKVSKRDPKYRNEKKVSNERRYSLWRYRLQDVLWNGMITTMECDEESSRNSWEHQGQRERTLLNTAVFLLTTIRTKDRRRNIERHKTVEFVGVEGRSNVMDEEPTMITKKRNTKRDVNGGFRCTQKYFRSFGLFNQTEMDRTPMGFDNRTLSTVSIIQHHERHQQEIIRQLDRKQRHRWE
ncbi:hypothetical protein HZH66_013875 [Vespula vulgaris]|uniref:Uncharacterized protein n=1 Tax=Vespula vulgaris TaxID=7454 RepID=A0A834J9J0_VESVU|nr:hypothetical protein HZH66_013875 [Vespula vulgaris]